MCKLSPKIFFLTLSFVMLANQSLVDCAILQCDYYSTTNFPDIEGSVYFCSVDDNGIFAEDRVRIDSVEGEYHEGYTIADVKGLRLGLIPSLKFFPRGLENVSVDLLAILIFYTNLQEIKQEDIKVFPKLWHLDLAKNKITTIDANLFEFNLELRYINLQENQISHIDPNVFDHLSNLNTLFLNENQCENALSYAYKSRSHILQLIERVRSGDCLIVQQQTTTTTQSQAANEECLAKYESMIEEKLKQNNELQQRKIETLEESIAELNKNLSELRDEIQKFQAENKNLKMDFDKIQSSNQDLMTTIENLTRNLSRIEGQIDA